MESSSPKSRAVVRVIEPGSDGLCASCGSLIRFVAQKKYKQVICNVYGRNGDPDVWDHIENWHEECYTKGGYPHGKPVKAPMPPYKRKVKPPLAIPETDW